MEGDLIQAIIGMSAGAKGIWLFGFILVSAQLLKWLAEYRAFRRLSIEEKQARREGFTAQVEFLTRQLALANERLEALDGDLAAEREAHDTYRRLCRAETDQLRGQITRLEDDLAALHRRRSAASVAAAHDLDPERAPHAAAAADRVAAHIEGGGDSTKTP